MADDVNHAAESKIVVGLVVDRIRMVFRGAGSMVIRKPKNRQIGDLIGSIQALEFLSPVIDAVLVWNPQIERRIVRVHNLCRRGNGRGYIDRVVGDNTAGGWRLAFFAQRSLIEVAPGIG